MIKLYDKGTGKYLGKITERDLQFLIDNLEEESMTDVDYYLTKDTLLYLKNKGISSGLLSIIEEAMGDKDEIEIEYKR